MPDKVNGICCFLETTNLALPPTHPFDHFISFNFIRLFQTHYSLDSKQKEIQLLLRETIFYGKNRISGCWMYLLRCGLRVKKSRYVV